MQFSSMFPSVRWLAQALFAVAIWTIAGCGGSGGGDSPNRPPVAALPAQAFAAEVGRTTTVNLLDYVSDPDGDPLIFAASTGAPWLSISQTGVILASPDVAAYHRGPGQLSVSISDGTSTIAVPVRFDPEAVAKASRVYGRDQTSASGILSLRVGDMDEPEIWIDGRRATDNALLEYEATWCSGRRISAAVEYSNTDTVLLVDDVPLDPAGVGYAVGLKCVEGTAMWLRIRPTTQDAVLQCIASGDTKVSCGTQLDYVPSHIAGGKSLQVFGKQLESGTYLLETFAPNGSRVATHTAQEPALLVESAGGNRLVTISGSSSLRALFWAVAQLVGPQYGEPFASGNDFLGRLGSNESERLVALTLLYEYSGDPELHAQVVGAVSRLLANADDNGLFFSKKYSLSRQTEIAFGIDVMSLYDAILQSYPLLGSELAAKSVDLAIRALNHYETDWSSGRYLLPSCADILYDGIVAPMNFQSRWGSVALRLFEITGEPRFRDRADTMRTYVLDQLEWRDGDRVWHYWPLEFYAGWDASKYVSCHLPSAPATTDTYLEDYSHAIATLEFLQAYDSSSGGTLTLDAEALARRLQADGNRFYFSLGRVAGELAERYLPYGYWAGTDVIAPYYESLVTLPIPDYDAQLIFQGHVRAAHRSMAAPGDQLQIRVTQLNDLGDATRTEEQVLRVSDAGCQLRDSTRRHADGGCTAQLRTLLLGLLPPKILTSERYPSTRSSPVIP